MFDSWFDIEDIDQICCIPLARSELQDKIFRSAPSSFAVQFYRQMWNVNMSPKMKRLNVNNICLCVNRRVK
ncbi:hypothetical protein GQ457_12G023600 [Hibiscus cannabinus]